MGNVVVWPVIATKDRPEWLEKQLDALSPQLRGDEKIIVVHDGDEFNPDVDGLPKIEHIWLRQNVGVDKARKVGNAFVPADAIVCEIDDHDIALPRLLRCLRAAFQVERVLWAYCDFYHSDPESIVKKSRRKGDGPIHKKGNLGLGMRAYRKWAYDAVDGYPLEYHPANDYALLCKLEILGGEDCACHIREPLITILEDVGGITRMSRKIQDEKVYEISTLVLNEELRLPFVLKALPPDEALPVEKRPSTIPKLLHFVWIGPPMPKWVEENIQRFEELNSDFVCLVHGEEVLLERYRGAYESIEGLYELSRKSDLLRISALFKFGGWYFDTDMVAFAPIADIYEDFNNIPCGFFATAHGMYTACNGVIGTSLNSPFLQMIDKRLTFYADQKQSYQRGMFGPDIFSELAEEHPELVTIGPEQMFYPYQSRAHAHLLYRQLMDDGEQPAMVFVDKDRVPYMLHMCMSDELVMPPVGDPSVVG